jgi:EAL domain-containing protein (putative c-di-GMP-specific phosphodiesterase class I)
LGYINEYPIDTIKIDRSFVSRLNETGEVSAIVRAVAQLAHDLNFQIVAEGIETREQFDFIKAVGCQYGQGYLFHKPLEKDKAEALLMEQGPDGK